MSVLFQQYALSAYVDFLVKSAIIITACVENRDYPRNILILILREDVGIKTVKDTISGFRIHLLRTRMSPVNKQKEKRCKMKLTPENKAYIDSLSYEELLQHCRHAPVGDKWFTDETGDYWWKHMRDLREEPGGQERHVTASKSIDR